MGNQQDNEIINEYNAYPESESAQWGLSIWDTVKTEKRIAFKTGLNRSQNRPIFRVHNNALGHLDHG